MSVATAPLRDLCEEIVVGHVGPSSGHRDEDGVPFLMGKNVGEGHLKLDSLERVTPAFHQAQKKSQVHPGDVLVVRIGQSGQAAKVPESLVEANCSGLVVIKRPTKVLADYLVQFLNSPVGRQQSLAETKGSTRQTLNTKSVAEAMIPVPSLTEQRRIADILDRVDVLRAKRREVLTGLDSLAHSIFLDMFGNPATNPKGWPSKPLGQLATKFSDGPFGSNLKSSHYTEDGIRVVRLQNIGVGTFLNTDKAFISEQHFATLKKHECLPGDVLVGTMGDPNLRACIQPEWLPIALNKADCVQVRPDAKICNGDYLCALLNEPETETMAHQLILGQTRLRISMGRLRELKVPVPPINIQTAFSERLRALQCLGHQADRSVAYLDNLFASLQHRAFQGEL